MSQFFVSSGASSVTPPEVATSYVTDDGTAIPAANVLNVTGGSGIDTSADPDLSDNLIIAVQNSFTDQATTIGAVTADISTIPLTVAGTYTFECRVAAWTATGPASLGCAINGVLRSDGVTATLINDEDGFFHSDASMVDGDVDIIASGNSAIVRVTGVAGLTINWGAFTVYVFRGA